MGVTLFPEQVNACADVDRLFNAGHRNVLCVLPTGVGKTIIKAEYARRNFNNNRVTIIFAHRDVLLGQISDACCLMGVSHSFICSQKTVTMITNANREKHGDSFHNEHSNIVVVSVDTFLARIKRGLIPETFLNSVYQWMIDESHHLTKGSKWGQCVEALPNAIGLGVTATPIRGDKKGLGAHADGYFNEMSVTASMFDSIKSGRLTPYKILAPDTVDTSGVKKDKNGDFNTKQLYFKTKEAGITGSAVEHYKKYLDGQPVITFGVNIEHCKEITKEFNDAGIRSITVSSKSPEAERRQAVADLRNGRIQNLVNCDLFGEGFDAPAVMGVIMLRRTESYSLYKQQFGRMLRSADGKTHGVLLDHVGNTKYFMEKFGLSAPHDDPEWTLDRGDTRRKSGDAEAEEIAETMRCSECSAFGLVKPEDYVNDGTEVGLLFIGGVCPECGHHETEEEKEQRKHEIKVKQGDLVPLEFDVIEALIEQRNQALVPVPELGKRLHNMPNKQAVLHRHARRQGALNILMHWTQKWCEKHAEATGQSVRLIQDDFEIKFGINILKAQTQTESKMSELAAKVQYEVNNYATT